MMGKHSKKNDYMLEHGKLKKQGYDWWWHSFTGYDVETGEEQAFFIEYYIMNPALGGDGPIYGQLEQHKQQGIKPSYALIKAGTWGKNKCQIHNFYAIHTFAYKKKPLQLKIGDNYLSETKLSGKVMMTESDSKDHPEYMSDAGNMLWQLKINKILSYDVGYGASWLLRKLNAFDMYWHVQGMRATYEGIVKLNDRTYNIIPEKSYGYQDKNWGCDFTSPWIWLNCNNITYKGTEEVLERTSLDLGGGRPVIFGKPIEGKILTMFYHEGKLYEYNFSKFWKGVEQSFEFIEHEDEVQWLVTSFNRHSKLEIDFRCKKEDMLFFNYENPHGEKRHNRLFNGGTAYGTIKLYEKKKGEYQLLHEFEGKNAGCEYGEYD